MSGQQGKLSLKDKITSHLPGHKHQDKNMNGIPDSMEKSGGYASRATPTSYATTPGYGAAPISGFATGMAPRTLSDMNGNGIPDSMERQQSSLVGGFNDRNGNGIPDNLERSAFGQQQSGYTDFNRNGIPDQLERQQFVGQQSGFSDVREAPTIVQQIQKPTVVHEVIKTEELVEIQPVIEREREQLDVYEVVQPMREREVVATEVRSGTLQAQTRATIIEDQSAFLAQRSAPADFSTREVAPTLHQTVQRAPIVHETITHKVVEEIQPVMYKEIDRPVIIKETLPIYEKVIEAPHAHHQTLPMRDLGSRGVQSTFVGTPNQGMTYQTTGLQSGIQSQGTLQPGFQQGFNQQGLQTDYNRNGIPDSMEHRRNLHDLNGNGIPDRMEKAHGLKDLNGNGIDDSLERRTGSTNLNSRTY